jgi:hypothetical protein
MDTDNSALDTYNLIALEELVGVSVEHDLRKKGTTNVNKWILIR